MENFSNDKKIISIEDYRWAAKHMNKIIGPCSFPILPEYLSKRELRKMEKERRERLEYLALYRKMLLEYEREICPGKTRQKENTAAETAKIRKFSTSKAGRIEKTRPITACVKRLFTFERIR